MNKGEHPAIDREDLPLLVEGVTLRGDLHVPADAVGLIVFSHGSGSSRHSPRNRWVAHTLQQAGLGTLLFDLLSEREDLDVGLRFDIPLLARRLTAVCRMLADTTQLGGLPLGLFGASTGAASALITAATLPGTVHAVVSRGGRPDLAMDHLTGVEAPTLLIVGGRDREVLALNRMALDRLTCVKELAVVPGANHLFEEPGTLDQVALLARDWYLEHLSVPPPG